MAPLPVLVTRPELGASATAQRLQAMGFRPVLAPLMTIAPLAAGLPPGDRVRAILVASQHAVPQLPDSHRSLPLFAVGDATAETARRHGFRTVHSADGDAVALAHLVSRSLMREGLPLLLAAGLGQGHYLARLLTESGFAVQRHEVYAARPESALPEAAIQLIVERAPGRVLLFSRETALCLRRLIQGTDLMAGFATLDLAAISRSVAEAVGDLPWRNIRVAMAPTEQAVLALLHD
jgi:uroporphyrinogen-III synthase